MARGKYLVIGPYVRGPSPPSPQELFEAAIREAWKRDRVRREWEAKHWARMFLVAIGISGTFIGLSLPHALLPKVAVVFAVLTVFGPVAFLLIRTSTQLRSDDHRARTNGKRPQRKDW